MSRRRSRPAPRWRPMAYPSRAASAELFADISDNNRDFDAHAYASAGHLLIAIKSSQGLGYVNPTWSLWTQAAHNANLAVAHYHFAAGDDPIAEAQHFWATVRPHFRKGVDRLVIDLEDPALQILGSGAGLWLARFDAEMLRLSGLEIIGYTFLSAMNGTLKLTGGKWWIAAWGTGQPGGLFRQLPGGQKLWAWQYAQNPPAVDPSGGPDAAAGIGGCDMNVLSPPIVALVRKALHR